MPYFFEFEKGSEVRILEGIPGQVEIAVMTPETEVEIRLTDADCEHLGKKLIEAATGD